ncbi:MAG: selenoneine synthase SenA [Chloroflexi bacterium]|nr:selenoneine synthase SenA [Chloroflexota bacterium]
MTAVMPFTSIDLCHLLEERRMHELELLTDLTDEQLRGVAMRDAERPIWELGHVGWFQEYWILRHLDGADPSMVGSDALYDSAKMYTHERGELAFPSRSETLEYTSAILRRCVERLSSREPDPEETYSYLLSIFHEDMHSETLTFIRQTLGYSRPSLSTSRYDESLLAIDADFRFHDVDMPGGAFRLGANADTPFVFDNEKWGHMVEVEPFSISATTVTNAEFLEFVEAGGYGMKGLWGKRGRDWLRRSKAQCPRFWQKGSDGGWYRKDFDQLSPLEPFHPVVHVNWYEANAYCNWAHRRLPTEAEWEMAAGAIPTTRESGTNKPSFPWGNETPTPLTVNMDWTAMACVDVRALAAGDSAAGCRQMIGNVWEWTADTFEAYPGFVVDPYREYSEPSFGKKKVLRGGSWATRSLLIRNTWRNFYMPFRNNIYAGFRTCAVR